MARRKKKSYNPFKMWGSYAGTYLLGFYMTFFDVRSQGSLFNTLLKGLKESFFWFGEQVAPIDTIIVLILGFFVGFGIHSLIRKVRK